MYSELDGLDFASLRERFEGPAINGDEYAISYYDEVAIRIRNVGGDEGVDYLLSRAVVANPPRLHATFLSLTMPPPVDRPGLRSLMDSNLGHADGSVVSAAIDGLAALGMRDDAAKIFDMREDARPLVRAAVLRFDVSVHEHEAIPGLVEALGDSDPIVRQAAIDGLDHLEAVQTASRVLELASDPDQDVRQAVETFMRNRQSD